jgi:hypothetical protein
MLGMVDASALGVAVYGRMDAWIVVGVPMMLVRVPHKVLRLLRSRREQIG